MSEIQRQWCVRILAGGILGGGLVLLLCGLVNLGAGGGALSGAERSFRLVNAEMEAAFGSPGLAGALVGALAFALGAAVGVSTLPFDDHGSAMARRSLLHFLITGGLFLALGRVCFWYKELIGGVFLLGIYLFLYLVVWLVRWLGWRSELSRLRAALNLPEPACSPLKWRESLPYLALLTALFLLLRPLAGALDAGDVPVLRALVLPWLAYPFAALTVGWAAGRTLGFAPLAPLTAFFAFVPNLLYSTVPYDWWLGLVYAALTLGANLLGRVRRRQKEGRG